MSKKKCSNGLQIRVLLLKGRYSHATPALEVLPSLLGTRVKQAFACQTDGGPRVNLVGQPFANLELNALLLTSPSRVPALPVFGTSTDDHHRKMSDSESDLSTPANLPTDTEIESTIRKVVRAGVQDDDFTINVARSRVLKELDLPVDFFKTDGAWKIRSKEFIQAAVNEFGEDEASEPEDLPGPETKSKPKAKAGTKRKSDDAPKAKPKRRKKSPSPELEDSEAEVSAADSEKSAAKPAKAKPKSVPRSVETSALSSPPEDDSEPVALKQNGNHKIPPVVEDDESDLSSVIDDPPPKKKRGSNTKSSSPSATVKAKPKPVKSSKAAPKPELSIEEEEIKRLQAWLIKCGIRKLWHRELAHCSTPKEKIKHLKGMLEEAGMTGRYSAEKARQIKESRELAAELEAAREFNQQWGQEDEDSEEEADGSKARVKVKEEKVKAEQPGKRRPRGLVDFGDSGEESD